MSCAASRGSVTEGYDFEERAAIIEFDAKLPRAKAERMARGIVAGKGPYPCGSCTIDKHEFCYDVSCSCCAGGK
jgi:hypothetical protein